MNLQNRTIFEGDNLHILRGIDPECIDLIYLDPPFNSNKTYEAPIGSEAAGAALSQIELRQYKTYKHTLFGLQEGKCNGCQYFLPFRNLTIDHILPRSRGGTNHPDNLQLLCQACNSTKGAGTQSELIAKLKATGVIGMPV